MLYTEEEEEEDYLKWDSYKNSLTSKLAVWGLILWAIAFLTNEIFNLNLAGYVIWFWVLIPCLFYYIYYKKMSKYSNHSKFSVMFNENLRLNEWWHNLTLFEKKEIKER